jgi:deoxyribonuclease-4
MLTIGRNINTKHGFITVAKYARDCGADVCQIFLSSPHTFQQSNRSKEEYKVLSDELIKHQVKVVVHGKYILNFCHPEDSNMHMQSIKLLVNELNNSVLLNAIGVIIHMGHNIVKIKLSDDDAFNNYVKGIKSVLKSSNPLSILILETGAGQGNEIGTDIIDLGKIRKALTKKEQERVKFCLDTCHMHAAGYDIGDVDYLDVLCGHIDLNLGWKNIAVIHLNDSKNKLACKKDRHEDIGKGTININGILKFITLCSSHNIPLVLETPQNHFKNDNNDNYRYTHKMQLDDIRKLLNKKN